MSELDEKLYEREASPVLRQSSRKERAAELRADDASRSASLRNSHSENASVVEFEDDGRTIADMSGVDGFRPAEPSGATRDIRDEVSDPEERRILVFGATMAGLSIGMVYVVAFGIVIALMYWLWN